MLEITTPLTRYDAAELVRTMGWTESVWFTRHADARTFQKAIDSAPTKSVRNCFHCALTQHALTRKHGWLYTRTHT